MGQSPIFKFLMVTTMNYMPDGITLEDVNNTTEYYPIVLTRLN